MEILLSIIACGLLTGLFTYLLLRQKHVLEKAKLSGEIRMLKTENVNLEFSEDGIEAIANIASEVNSTVENIGARRLHTIIEKILDEISFTATDRSGEKILINKEYINKNLDNLVKDTDLSKFIL